MNEANGSGEASSPTLTAAHNEIANDGVDRRGFLKCMAWAGTGLVWTFAGGVPTSRLFGERTHGTGMHGSKQSDFSFVQISDSHIGFNKAANADVTATLQAALDKIDAQPQAPDFLIHTGDLTHSAKPAEFDTLNQMLGAKRQVFYVPGEHDTAVDDGKTYLDRYGKGSQGNGWYSFDSKGCHFVGLVNVFGKSEQGMGILGADQLAWLKKDLAGVSNSTPIVVFAHVPLWEVYAKWGWGTTDGAQALDLLKGFGSVTVLNGHIHQVTQKVEGNMTFHTARSTAFPQPAPGTAAKGGPMVVPADQLRGMLGLTSVNYVEVDHHLALVDSTLAGT